INLAITLSYIVAHRQFWLWTSTIHEISPVISNEYNALAVKHQTTIKHKTNDNDDADVSATKIAGKDVADTKIVGKKGNDAMKIVQEGPDATKIAGEWGDATEDQKTLYRTQKEKQALSSGMREEM
uniref:Uncharacterized protein n=1 Tax=Romanomermis culicivorax TaxID=13658 RepID=A0A915INW1_ROMCU